MTKGLSRLAASLMLLGNMFLSSQLATAYGSTAGVTCKHVSVPVTVSSTNLIWIYPKFKNNFDVAQYNANAVSRSTGQPLQLFKGTENTTAKYSISGTFCTPSSPVGGHEKTVLIASHGSASDRSYWDYPSESNSFSNFVVSRGYSIFFYDRLGAGESSKISGYVDQASIQVGVLGELIKAVRLGRCSGSAGVPKSVVLVGHSFGSVISNAIVASIPGAADGLILTGLGYTGFDFKTIWGTLQARLPSQEQHDMLANLDTGYLDAGDLYSFVGGQFHQPNYDVQVARNAFSRRQLFAVTEIPSSAQHSLLADKFTGPVMVISGEFDLPVCGGYCPDVLEAGAAPVFPASRNFKAYVQPNTGHALNLHKNATAGYAVITDFLASNGF